VGEHSFIIQLSESDGSSCSENSQCSSSFCVHGICRSVSYYCGDSWCDSGESCSSCASDCGSCEGSVPTTTKNKADEEDELDELMQLFDSILKDLKKGEEFEVDLSKVGLSAASSKLKSLKIIPDQDAEEAELSISNYYYLPKGVDELDNYLGYYYIDITLAIPIQSAEMEIEVSNTWLVDQDKIEDDVLVLHYTDNWQELETEFLRKDDVSSYFKATTEEFSMFAVTVENKEEDAPESEDVSLLIFLGLIAIILFSFFSLYIFKRKVFIKGSSKRRKKYRRR